MLSILVLHTEKKIKNSNYQAIKRSSKYLCPVNQFTKGSVIKTFFMSFCAPESFRIKIQKDIQLKGLGDKNRFKR